MKPFKVVDVFTTNPLLGNPVAVVFDADDLDTAGMQAIARWTNLSETTFFQAPTTAEADYRLRIFTPRGELPFAGHPTLGSAHAALEAGRVSPREGQVVQECGAGLVRIGVTGSGADQRLTLELPPAKLRDLSDGEITELEEVLGVGIDRKVAPAVVDVGAVWIVARLADAQTVIGLKPNLARCSAFDTKFGATGVVVFGKYESGESAIEVRAFAPSHGVDEDPVCGSGNGSVAVLQYRRGVLETPDYVASQGQCVGRDGRVALSVGADGTVHVGGASVTCVDGTLNL